MTNEDILKAVQASPAKEGEAEIATLKKAVTIGSLVCLIICVATFLVKLVLNRFDFIEFLIGFSFQAVVNLFYGVKCKNLKSIVLGSIEMVLGIASFLLFLGVMFK